MESEILKYPDAPASQKFRMVTQEILERVGQVFSIGCLSGSAYYFASGMVQAPKGQRVRQSLVNVRDRTTYFAGSMAIWCLLFDSCRYSLMVMRGKEDKWNSVAGGFVTSVLMHIRSNFRAGLQQGWYTAMFILVFYSF